MTALIISTPGQRDHLLQSLPRGRHGTYLIIGVLDASTSKSYYICARAPVHGGVRDSRQGNISFSIYETC